MATHRALLVGRDRRRARRGLLVAVAVATQPVTLTLPRALARVGVSVDPASAWSFWAFTVFAVALATRHAYRNDGLVVCVALGVAPLVGLFLVLTWLDAFTPDESLLWGVAVAVTLGVPLGLLGFVIGAGGRRVRAGLLG